MSWFGNILGSVGQALSFIPGVGDVFSGFSAAEQEADQRQYQNDFSWTQMHNQFMLNSELMDKANAFASNEAQIAREWNSLPNQMARAGDAGINPLAILGSTGAGGSTAQASPVSASVGLPSMSHMPNGIVDLAALSQVLMNRTQASKTGKETARYDEQVDALVSNIAADISLKKAQKDAQDIANDITRTYGKTEASFRCLKFFNEALKLAEDGKLAKAQRKVADATEALRKSEKETVDMERPLIKQRMEKEIELVGEQSKTEKSKQAVNYSEAELKRQMAKTVDGLRSGEIEMQSLQNDLLTIEKIIQGNESKVSDAVFEERVKATIEELSRQKLISEDLKYKLMQDAAVAKWADRQQYMQYWTGFFGTAANVVGSASSAGNVYVNRLNQKDRNFIQDRFTRAYENAHRGRRTNYTYGENGWTPVWRQEVE